MKKLFRKLSLRRMHGETKEQFDKRTAPLRVLYIGIPFRFAVITLITLFFSMGFKLVIEQGFFSRYKTALALLLAYYYVQIGLLGVYFVAVAIYFGICRRREKKLYLHLLYCTVAQALFVALTLLVYKTTSENFYLWTFRITENIARLNATYKPPNMVPYILIFHALTYAVMFVEMPIGLLFEFLWKKINEKVDFGRLIHSFGGDRGDNGSALRALSARTTGLNRRERGHERRPSFFARLIGSDSGRGGHGGRLHDFGTRLISPDRRYREERPRRRRRRDHYDDE